MEKGLLEKTGRPLEEWIKVVKEAGLEKHSEIITHLKSEHSFTHGFANFVALKARESDAASFDKDDLVEAQYNGKESLRPIYEKLLKAAQGLGNDVEVVPKKTSVSIRTGKQFALIQPTTKTRIDLGLKITGREPAGRLENSGPFGSMCSHRVQLTDIAEVDDEVLGYLREAYESSK